MKFSEWLSGFVTELTIDAESTNRLWQKINSHCLSNGVSVDMENSDIDKGVLTVVRYEDCMPLQGVSLRITKDDSGAHSRVIIAGREMSGRVVKVEVEDHFDNEEPDRGG